MAIAGLALSGCSTAAPAARATDIHVAAAEPGRTPAVTVDSDRVDRDRARRMVRFSGDVAVRQDASRLYADELEVYLHDDTGRWIVRAVATGNVRIVTADCRTATAARAEYDGQTATLLLSGDVRLVYPDRVVRRERLALQVDPTDAAVPSSGCD